MGNNVLNLFSTEAYAAESAPLLLCFSTSKSRFIALICGSRRASFRIGDLHRQLNSDQTIPSLKLSSASPCCFACLRICVKRADCGDSNLSAQPKF